MVAEPLDLSGESAGRYGIAGLEVAERVEHRDDAVVGVRQAVDAEAGEHGAGDRQEARGPGGERRTGAVGGLAGESVCGRGRGGDGGRHAGGEPVAARGGAV